MADDTTVPCAVHGVANVDRGGDCRLLGVSIELYRLRRLTEDYPRQAVAQANRERELKRFLSDQGECLAY